MFRFFIFIVSIINISIPAQHLNVQKQPDITEGFIPEQEIQIDTTSDILTSEDDPEQREHFRTVNTTDLIVDISKYHYGGDYFYLYEYHYPKLGIKLRTSYLDWRLCHSEDDEEWKHFPYLCKMIDNLFISSGNRIEYRFSSDKFVESFKKSKNESLYSLFKKEMQQKYEDSHLYSEEESCYTGAFHDYYYCTDGRIAFIESPNQERYLKTPYTPGAVLYTIDDIEFLE